MPASARAGIGDAVTATHLLVLTVRGVTGLLAYCGFPAE